MNDIKRNSSYTKYLNDFKNTATTITEKEMVLAFELRLKLRSGQLPETRFIEILNQTNNNKNLQNSTIYPRILSYIAYKYSISGEYNEAIKYLHLAIKLLSHKKGIENMNRLASSYILMAGTHLNKKDLDSSHYYLNKIPINDINGFIKKNIESYKYYYKWLTHENQKNYDSTTYYKLKFYELDYELKINENNHNIQNLTEKYQNASLKKRNKTTIYVAIFVLLLLFLLGTFIYKNTKRKQLLAEQEKELQTQKLATVLKEQELTSIDAMIEGQEKERQRIANDLHDDLGGLMATVKLHFNALKEKQTPELFDKTTQLLDDAYNKVRSVAHSKNSGVMAKKGLLKAINDMAKTVSSSSSRISVPTGTRRTISSPSLPDR